MVEVEHGYGHRARQVTRSGMHQQQYRRTVAQHVLQALRRITRIQRHIGAPGLDDGPQADHQFQAALDADRHPRIGLHALLAQAVRQLVGPLVELAIGQASLARHHSHGLRCASDLGLEHLLDGLFEIMGRLSGIPRCQPLGFGRRDQHKLAQRQDGVFQSLLEHESQPLGQCLDLGGLEVGLVVDEVDPGLVVITVAAQMKGQRCRLVTIGHLHGVCLRLAVPVIMVILLIGHRYFEQLAAILAQQAQRTVHLAQGVALVPQVLPEDITYTAYQFAERQPIGKIETQRADLGKQSQGRLEAGIATVKDRYAEHPVIALRSTGEAEIHRRQQHMEGRGLAGTRQGLHPLVQ